jgi:hypothetical protein
MSAPNQGRQSPDPERQTESQQQKPPATDPNKQGQGEEQSKEGLKNLESNPKHVLQEEADKKVDKK